MNPLRPYTTPVHPDDDTAHGRPPANGVLSALIRSSDASREPSHRARPPTSRPRSYPPASNVSNYRMSRNPAHEITDSLRFSSLTSPAHSDTSTSSVTFEPVMIHEMEVDERRGEHVQQTADKMDATLPENDGMEALRQKLHEIRTLAASTEEKAQMMHILMTQEYTACRAVSTSPLSLGGSDRKLSSDEPASLDVGVAAVPINPRNPYNICEDDLVQTYSPLRVAKQQDDDEAMEDHQPTLGCMHYMRNVKIQCFDCHRWFSCRHCHDQSHDLPFPHTLRRKMTQNMLCMLCKTPQPAGEVCMNCEEYAAYYYCSKCKLWDNDSNKSIYHCDDCGICRLGEGLGRDYVHCKKCNVCITISTSAAHPCIEKATEGDCPLCLEEMFASRAKAVSLPCGHYMHGECYKDLMGVTYKCPVCSKSAVNMELQWKKLDDEIQLQPMPEDEDEELDRLITHVEGHTEDNGASDPNQSPRLQPRRPKNVWIGCNDCSRRCWTAFHWLGLKCVICDSYNTSQMVPTAGHETETERLIRQQATHRQHDFTGNTVLREAGIGADDISFVDSALDVPSSPSLLAVPASPRSQGSPSSGAQSPGRYFVRDDEPRRPSFTSQRFSTPTLPTLANLPEMPRLPRMPNIPSMPNMPNLPNVSSHFPNMPNMPNMPNIPNFELPRFSPYDMFDSLSRNLSPMRYYLQGQDQRDMTIRRDSNRSATSIHSAPAANLPASIRKGSADLPSDEDEAIHEAEFWGAARRRFFSRDHDRRQSDGGVQVDGEGDDEEESDSDSDTDAEMVDDDLDGGDDDEDMELFGHR